MSEQDHPWPVDAVFSREACQQAEAAFEQWLADGCPDDEPEHDK